MKFIQFERMEAIGTSYTVTIIDNRNGQQADFDILDPRLNWACLPMTRDSRPPQAVEAISLILTATPAFCDTAAIR
jgi:hypothetical protein